MRVFRADADPRVVHRDAHGGAVRVPSHGDHNFSGLRELDCIGQKVQDNLANARLISHKAVSLRKFVFMADFQAFAFCFGAKYIHGVQYGLIEIEAPGMMSMTGRPSILERSRRRPKSKAERRPTAARFRGRTGSSR